jgi:hypothetical protein
MESRPPDASGTLFITAPCDVVYGLISDLDDLVKVSEETFRVIRRRGFTGRAGSRFVGLNRRGRRVWFSFTKLTDTEPGRRYGFNVSFFGIPGARWLYEIEPQPGGCQVTESTWDRRTRWYAALTVPFTGVHDRPAVNDVNIRRTLERLKATAEAAA